MIREYYTGCRPGDNREPIVLGTKGALLPPRHDLVAYDCPFAWGNESHGALALALAILADWAGDDLARRHHVAFAWEVLAGIEPADFEISAQRVQDWLEDRLGASRSATAAWQRLLSTGGREAELVPAPPVSSTPRLSDSPALAGGQLGDDRDPAPRLCGAERSRHKNDRRQDHTARRRGILT